MPAPAAPAEDTGRHLVWRVAKGMRTVAFLVGSVHVLTKAAYPLPAGVRHGVRAVGHAGRGSRSRRRRATSRRCCPRRPARCSPTARRCARSSTRRPSRRSRPRRRRPAMPTGAGRAHEAVAGLDAAGGAGTEPGRLRSGAGARPPLLRAGPGGRAAGARAGDRRLPGGAAQRPAAAGPGRDAEGDARRRRGPGASRWRRSSRRGAPATWRPSTGCCCSRSATAPAIYQRLLVERNRNWVPLIARVRRRTDALPGRGRRRPPARPRRAGRRCSAPPGFTLEQM